MEIVGSVLWRRLDVFGSDACALLRHPGGWRLIGTASFAENGARAALAYQVDCGADWRSRAARISGFWGRKPVEIEITRDAGGWRLNGIAQDGLPATPDLDLGFTPATNLLAIRRLGLAPGEAADAPAAWLDLPERRLSHLPQWYRRIAPERYAYRSPSAGYEDVLTVSPLGFVTGYPGLWQAEPER